VFSGTVLWFDPKRGVGGIAVHGYEISVRGTVVWSNSQTGHGHLTRDA
jgi:cold shock CspA family protein